MRLERDFYERSPVTLIAQELIGKVLCTKIDGVLTQGRIVETEAYAAVGDKACHAHLGRFTERTKTMYEAGGTAYIYLCYGIHHLFNISVNVKGVADAVLIRGLEPLYGTEAMLRRRNLQKPARNLTAGPGILAQAMGLSKAHNGHDLCRKDSLIWVENDGFQNRNEIQIETGPRVGLGADAEEDALLPWRYWLRGSKWKSPAK
ncbi:DNA-3-methyladenine glycosylase [Cyclonatronum proteinivorum]|uniref:Putative 3-methyladenine DNA glycosylase n=1 Tax=Cyclonatronum proteinivorum TaxID=1457365 RepID=A0A345UIC5_9BACT|nr:DNA-3-methyladenine glycosylase [Cyclonatronum proteinivorum]AXJ00227.1 DNA-3-methyladenine glycosylase [Cyclonatronum proteinivorum]